MFLFKIHNKNSIKNNTVYGNFLLAQYERKIKNYQKELDYLTKGHQEWLIIKRK